MTVNREKVTAQAVADLRSRLADAAIEWAKNVAAEESRDERIPRRESNVLYRYRAASVLQEIRRLTAELDRVRNKG